MSVRFSSFQVKEASDKKQLKDFCHWAVECCYVRYTTVYDMLHAFSAITGITGIVSLKGDMKDIVTLTGDTSFYSKEASEFEEKYAFLKGGDVDKLLLEPYYKEQEKLQEARERDNAEMLDCYGYYVD